MKSFEPLAVRRWGGECSWIRFGVVDADKKCEPANSMSQVVHAGSWQAVMELPDIS